jgi:hypothetical protein
MTTDKESLAKAMIAVRDRLVEYSQAAGALAEAVGALAGCLTAQEPDGIITESLDTKDDHGPSQLDERWAELVELRPEYAAVAIDGDRAEPDRQLGLALSRLSASDNAVLAAKLPDEALQPSDAEASTEAELNEQLASVIGDRYPRLRRAMIYTGIIARHGAGLGRINLKATAGGEWLRPFTVGDFDALWAALCEPLADFADEAKNFQDRRLALVRVDMNLRTLVPAVFASDEEDPSVTRILPPEPDSKWAGLLAGVLAELTDFCAGNGFDVGHAQCGFSLRDNKRWHNVDSSQSFRQPVPAGARDAYRVLWALRAWSGRPVLDQSGELKEILDLDRARVVYGDPSGAPVSVTDLVGGHV